MEEEETGVKVTQTNIKMDKLEKGKENCEKKRLREKEAKTDKLEKGKKNWKKKKRVQKCAKQTYKYTQRQTKRE